MLPCARNSIRRKLFLSVILSLFVFLGNVPNIYALTFNGVGIKPAAINGARDWFIYSLGPGESVEDYLEVINDTDEENTIRLAPYDSEPSDTGDFALSGPNSEQKGIGKWVIMEEKEVVLASREKKIIKFKLQMPDDADVGEHSGAITAQSTATIAIKGIGGAAIGTRVGARIYNTVPGEIIRKITIINFTVSENIEKNIFEAYLTAQNEGNISMSPIARLHMDGWGLVSKKEIFHSKVLDDRKWQLLRGAKVDTSWKIPKPYFGKFTLYVSLNYEEKDSVATSISTQKVTIMVIPWRDAYILIAIVLILISMITGLILYKKKKYSGNGWDEYEVKETDNVMSLAQKYHIPWKFLVKVNRIKKPYFLTAGDIILVPLIATAKESTKAKDSTEKPIRKEKKVKKDRMKGVFLIVIIILTTIVLVLGIAIFIKSIRDGKGSDELDTQVITEVKDLPPTPTPEPAKDIKEEIPGDQISTTTIDTLSTTTPTSTPPIEEKIILDKSKVRIQILNGSGTLGLAGVYAKKIIADGFSSVNTGNAKSFDQKDVLIRYVENMKEAADIISKILQEDYKNIILEKVESKDIDVEVTLGSK